MLTFNIDSETESNRNRLNMSKWIYKESDINISMLVFVVRADISRSIGCFNGRKEFA